MSNNRLYIRDTKTNDQFLLAKSFSSGWEIFNPDDLADRLGKWLSDHDEQNKYGAVAADTDLTIETDSHT